MRYFTLNVHGPWIRIIRRSVQISMVYLVLLYVSLFLRKQHLNCSPAADHLDKMASQPCGGKTQDKPTQCVYS